MDARRKEFMDKKKAKKRAAASIHEFTGRPLDRIEIHTTYTPPEKKKDAEDAQSPRSRAEKLKAMDDELKQKKCLPDPARQLYLRRPSRRLEKKKEATPKRKEETVAR